LALSACAVAGTGMEAIGNPAECKAAIDAERPQSVKITKEAGMHRRISSPSSVKFLNKCTVSFMRRHS
jgi:hypothetical protein